MKFDQERFVMTQFRLEYKYSLFFSFERIATEVLPNRLTWKMKDIFVGVMKLFLWKSVEGLSPKMFAMPRLMMKSLIGPTRLYSQMAQPVEWINVTDDGSTSEAFDPDKTKS